MNNAYTVKEEPPVPVFFLYIIKHLNKIVSKKNGNRIQIKNYMMKTFHTARRSFLRSLSLAFLIAYYKQETLD